MRFRMTREFYVPKNAEQITAADSSAVAYLSTGTNGAFYAVGFSGKRNKPDFNYRFRSEQQAREHIAQHAARVKQSQETAAERHRARFDVRAADHFAVGDLLYTSWGYDQTNIDFYKIVRVLDKSVEIVAIGAKSVPDTQGFMSEALTPDATVEIREGYGAKYNGIKRVQGGCNGEAHVKVMPHSSGHRIKPGEHRHCSWYA